MTERQILEQKITDLKSQLASDASRVGDWAIIKCYEARLAGKDDPYNVDDLLVKRQAIRDQINEAQAQLAALPEEDEQ